MSRTPDRDICRVRGWGRAQRHHVDPHLDRRSASSERLPNRCSSSTITKTQVLGLRRPGRQPVRAYDDVTEPAANSFKMTFCSADERKREIISTLTGTPKRSRNVP